MKNANSFAKWALKNCQKEEVEENVEYEGKIYRCVTKSWMGNIGKRAAKIYREIGDSALLVNEEFETLTIRRFGQYKSDFGKLGVFHTVYTEVA